MAEEKKDKQAEEAAEPKAEKPKATKAKPKAAESKAEKPKAAAKAKAEKADAKPKAEKAKAKAEKADAKPKADAPADEGKTDEKESKPKRRGAAETSARKDSAPPAPTNDDGVIEVRAKARYVRSAPRKTRLVIDHIRGKSVVDARAILQHTQRSVATDVAKVLESAIANAENNFELDPDELRIHRATVDEGPTIKRFRPRALGRATPIHKRTSHITITLTTASGPAAGRAGAGKAR